MKKQVLFTFILAIVATMWTGTVQAQPKYYRLHICGRQVTSANCKDLSVIDGVSGKASYDPDTATKQGIYTLGGVRLQGELNDLPKGVYIVNGQKVVKK